MTSERYKVDKRRKEELETRRVNAWLQAERIAKYLPTLYRKRAELMAQVEEYTDLIADEERAEQELRHEADPRAEPGIRRKAA